MVTYATRRKPRQERVKAARLGSRTDTRLGCLHSMAHLPSAAPAAAVGAPDQDWTGSHGCRAAAHGTSMARIHRTCRQQIQGRTSQ
jgi:hypothetical protein